MSEKLRLIGLEMSPYSVKVRSYLRYKRIPFEWIDRSRRNEALGVLTWIAACSGWAGA